ncbi:MAG: UDP-N-acetylmuramoyl-L-alanyl-D-glutamate--2,6-diaminopimelate ligase [Candidatus Omnitrophica bacterium]|nr:UDP-N-acetylmuramoyl-L-alanyl-D-glutamate--2,6-diaminopimelate ligase [Candidatus Omnitrophota bacterium]
MRIKELFPHLNLKKETGELKVKGISDDSRLTKKGDIFFVRERKNFDIFSVLRDVEEKAVVYVGGLKHKEELKRLTRKPIIFVNEIEWEFHRAADFFYGFRRNDLKFIGVTGTNGKTTVAHLIYHFLKKLGEKVSLIGTVNYFIGEKVYAAKYTTPGYLTLRKLFKEIKDNGGRFVVMEASSHAIAQKRVEGIDFLRCVFTNLSRDHLDYHKTFKNYFNTKRKLFLHNKNSPALINIDDFYGRKLLKELKGAFSYGVDSAADFRARNIRLTKAKTRFDLVYRKESHRMETQLLGRHNILNILAAAGTLFSLGFPLASIVKLVPLFNPVEGRLEQVAPGIFLDYAHTPDAFKKVFLTLKEIGYEKIICVFGCGGDRDRGKREIMGKIACELADFNFITSDNPRNEDPIEICCQIKKGFSKGNYFIMPNRRKAIGQAVKLFNQSKKRKCRNFCILVAGKGHERYQIIGDKKLPFKDRDVIKEEVRSRGGPCVRP